MARVTVRINGYVYTVGCEDGQEEHLTEMAAEVEQRIDSIKAIGGQSGEGRLLVLAALLLADELHDANNELDIARRAPLQAQLASSTETHARLRRLAARAEEIAADLAEA
jgi:cell division protein ZapA